MTLPGLVLLILVLAVVEHAASRTGRRSLLARRRRPTLTATGMDFMAVLTTPGKEVELEQRAHEKVRRVGSLDGAPGDESSIDLDAGTAWIVRSPASDRWPDAGPRP